MGHEGLGDGLRTYVVDAAAGIALRRNLSSRWGRRVRGWPEPLRESMDGPSSADALSLGMSGMPPGILVRMVFAPCPASWKRSPEIGEIGTGNSSPSRHQNRPDPNSFSRRREVTPVTGASPLFWATTASVVVPAESSEHGSTKRLISTIEALLRSRKGNGIRFLRARLPIPWRKPWFAVSEDELACLLPGLDGPTVPFETNQGESLPTLPLGRSPTGRVIGPPVEPGQGRHLAVLGETGMGKSSTLVAVARKASTLGGVILFDPLGETACSFVSALSTNDRSRLLEISPQAAASAINALEGIGGPEGDAVLSDRRLNDLVHALRRVRSGRYVDSSYWGPRLEEMLTRALRAAAAFPNGTLADAHTLLATGGRSRQVVPPSAQDDVREQSERIRQRPDDAEGARRLLYEVVRSPVLLRLLCERTPALHARDLVAPGRIVVISGNASAVGESVARYLLSVYLALVWSELLARPSLAKTFVVLDESQWFSHESLAEMLRLARRRNVHVVLATQTIGSLPESVAEAVWTNVSDFVAFRGSPEEARELSRATPGVSVEEMLALPRGHAAVLLGKGGSVDWLRTTGRPPASVVPITSLVPAPSVHDAQAARPPDRAPSASVGSVLTWIAERSRGMASGELLRVELDELRRSVDPGGRTIREVGSKLGRVGALLASERSAAGPVWVLDPKRIPLETEPSRTADTSAGAEAPKPS